MSVPADIYPETTPQINIEEYPTIFDGSEATDNQLWRDVRSDESALVTRAMVRAQEVRSEASVDPGDAFMQGFMIALSLRRSSTADIDIKQPRKSRSKNNLRLLKTTH